MVDQTFGASGLVWPALAAMKDGDDLEPPDADPVRNHVRRARNHELPRPGDTTRPPEIRQIRQAIDGSEERRCGPSRRLGVLAGYVGAKSREVADRPR